ncbi:hypothetical protein V6N11_084262 [Hibiscus sabdariffa]|uniref:Uncharacterized protein n=1 Tax=Hibiscus sabdariffa TaxID=183260 RepID=A0ABR2QSS4_9ROSI
MLNSTVQEFVNIGLQAIAKNEEFLEGYSHLTPFKHKWITSSQTIANPIQPPVVNRKSWSGSLSINLNPSISCEPTELECKPNSTNLDPSINYEPTKRGCEVNFICMDANHSSEIPGRFHSHTHEPNSGK